MAYQPSSVLPSQSLFAGCGLDSRKGTHVFSIGLEFFAMTLKHSEEYFEWFGFQFCKNIVMADGDDFRDQVFAQRYNE